MSPKEKQAAAKADIWFSWAINERTGLRKQAVERVGAGFVSE